MATWPRYSKRQKKKKINMDDLIYQQDLFSLAFNKREPVPK